MKSVNLQEAKTRLQQLVARAAKGEPSKLSPRATELIGNEDNRLFFSAASLWEIVIKNGLGRPNFRVDPHLLRRGFVDNG